MPARQQFDPQYLDADHQRLVEFADWAYADDPEERTAFLDYHMERRGYQRTSGWAAPPPPDPNQPPDGGGGAPAPGPRRPAYFNQRSNAGR